MEKTRIFVSKHCNSCRLIKEMVKNKKVSEKDVEVIDVETDEGFPYIQTMQLSGVPSAYKGIRKCELKIDEETDTLIIICPVEQNPTEDPLSSAQGQSFPPSAS